MKGFLTTYKGMENIAALEVNELIGKKPKISETCIVFEINKFEDLFKLCYHSQSATGIFYLLHQGNYNNLFEDFRKIVPNIKFDEWLTNKSKFRVKCIKNMDIGVSTPDIEKKIGELIIDHIQKRQNYKQKVNLENPDIIISIYLSKNRFYVGVDFNGFDLSKRSYKVIQPPADIKGPIAYFLIRLSDFNNGETFLDVFSYTGTLPIEATLYASNFPINYFNKEKFNFLKFIKFKNYDFKKIFEKLDDEIKNITLKIYNLDTSMKYLNYAKKNSKIAGIGKKIIFSRMDIEWLDTKFKKNSIDKIVTRFPPSHKKNLDKIYSEFFYQAEFILKNNG